MPATVNGVATTPDSHGIVYGDGIGANGNYTGTSSSDHLAGTGGNDQLQGGSGFDYYYGAGGNDTFKLTAKDFDTTSGDCQKFIYDFGGAGGWSASNNDFLNLSGFGAGAKLTFDHDAAQKSTNYPDAVSSYYTITNDAGLHVTIMVQSLDGSHLAKGDYNFY